MVDTTIETNHPFAVGVEVVELVWHRSEDGFVFGRRAKVEHHATNTRKYGYGAGLPKVVLTVDGKRLPERFLIVKGGWGVPRDEWALLYSPGEYRQSEVWVVPSPEMSAEAERTAKARATRKLADKVSAHLTSWAHRASLNERLAAADKVEQMARLLEEITKPPEGAS